MSQNHFTLSFPLKSPADAKALAEQLPPLMPGLFSGGGRHRHDSLLALYGSEREDSAISWRLRRRIQSAHGRSRQARRTGVRCHLPACGRIRRPLRSPITQTLLSNGPRSISSMRESLHRLSRRDRQGDQGLGVCRRRHRRRRTTPIPGDPAHQIKTCFIEVELLLRARGHGTTKDLDKVGTPHFAQFVPLEDNQIGFFTVYDGDFDTYIADFTKNIGQVFDLLFKFTKGAPPSPCRKHLQEFIDFADGSEPHSDRVLSGISRPECSGHPCPDRR